MIIIMHTSTPLLKLLWNVTADYADKKYLRQNYRLPFLSSEFHQKTSLFFDLSL